MTKSTKSVSNQYGKSFSAEPESRGDDSEMLDARLNQTTLNQTMTTTESAAWSRVRFITGEIALMLNLLTVGNTLRPGVATPELIGVLLGYLKEVATFRASGELAASSLDARLWQEYRAALELLRSILPKMEQQLQNDRSRLAHDQEQLSRASAWTSASKLTR